MKRTTIFLTDEEHDILRRLAFERRTSMASLIRRAVREIAEDAEDVVEGRRSLAEGGPSIPWEDYKRQRNASSTAG